MARPPLPRYRADIRLALEFSAEDDTAAEQRLAALLDRLRPRLEAAVRGARVGASTPVTVDTITDPTAI